MTGLSKQLFLAAYERALVEHTDELYSWTRDEARLAKFMASVRRTICGAQTDIGTVFGASWNHDSPVARQVWRQYGQKGKMTLKALRGLPE